MVGFLYAHYVLLKQCPMCLSSKRKYIFGPFSIDKGKIGFLVYVYSVSTCCLEYNIYCT